MKYVIIFVVAAGAYFAWTKYRGGNAGVDLQPSSSDKTPAANMENRINNLSGAAPTP
jgi:hypothetical protein